MFDRFLDLLFPRVSLQNIEGMRMTDDEFSALVSFPVRIETDALRSMDVCFLDRIVAASSYEASPLLRTAVHRFKYGRQRPYERELGTILVDASHMIHTSEDMMLCPVPLHWLRFCQRGFNQSERLAHMVAEERGWQMQSLLQRTHATGHQAHRSHMARKDAVADAFALTTATLPSHVILIDDVATTGATLDACAAVLKKAGVERVDALVLAKG